jgi:hypothetical protein
MPEIGKNLSHYSIVEKIGKGGMGEAYRARDQMLGRDVVRCLSTGRLRMNIQFRL